MASDGVPNRLRPRVLRRSYRGRAALAQHRAGASGRPDRDVSPARDLEAVAHGAKLARCQDAADHELHLKHREARSEAAASATAERDPGVGARWLVQKALGTEGVGIRIDAR